MLDHLHQPGAGQEAREEERELVTGQGEHQRRDRPRLSRPGGRKPAGLRNGCVSVVSTSRQDSGRTRYTVLTPSSKNCEGAVPCNRPAASRVQTAAASRATISWIVLTSPLRASTISASNFRHLPIAGRAATIARSAGCSPLVS